MLNKPQILGIRQVAAALLALALGWTTGAGAQVTFEGLVRELGDSGSLARLPDPPYRIEIFTVRPGGDQGVIERAGRTERVLCRVEGPGAVVRVWSSNPAGTLRIYLDAEDTPEFEAPAADLLSGRWRVAEPFAQSVGGTGVLIVPIPFAGGCVITSDAGSEAPFSITVRRYDASTEVRSFALGDLDAWSDDLADTAAAMREVDTPGPTALYESGLDITKASSIPISFLEPGQKPRKFFPARQIEPERSDLPEGGRAIGSITIKLFKYFPVERTREELTETELAHALRHVTIGFNFDDKVASYAPLGDFMGTGIGLNVHTDYLRTVAADGTMRCRWIMPYRESAVIELHNLSDTLDIWAQISVRVVPWTWDERSMYFITHWRTGLESEPGERWADVALAANAGRLVAQTLTVMNPVPGWWGGLREAIAPVGEGAIGPLDEADVFGVVEGVTSRYGSLLQSRPRADGADAGDHLGHTTLNRLYALDSIPFVGGMSISLEASESARVSPDLACVLSFYVADGGNFQSATTSYFEHMRSLTYPPKPEELEGPIECETLERVRTAEGVQRRVRALFPRTGGIWSGDSDLYIDAAKSGDWVELTVPAPDAQPRRLTLYASGGADAGIVRIFVGGEKVVGLIDLSSEPSIARSGPIDLGVHTPVDGRFMIRVEAMAIGRQSGIPDVIRPDALLYGFGLDCVVLGEPGRAGP